MTDLMGYVPRQPRVTVLMPVYNGELYLREALESILNQTFSDFEFLIINDGSTDRSVEIIKSYDDPRIRLLHNEENLGLIATLNKGLALTKDGYVARMDQDDVSLPERLEKQVTFMDSHPDVGVCGSWVSRFSDTKSFVWKFPVDSEQIKCVMFYNAGVAHPSVMLRKEIFLRNNLSYDSSYLHAEDFDLWVRAIEHTRFANIPEVLLHYRTSPTQITTRSLEGQIVTAARVRERQLNMLGIYPDEKEKKIHESIMNASVQNPATLSELYAWMAKIKSANRNKRIYLEPYFSRQLTKSLLRMTAESLYRVLTGKSKRHLKNVDICL